MALPLSSILPLYWPGQGWSTENDDERGLGIIVGWAEGNTLPRPTVEQVRAREAEAVATLAALAKERQKLDDVKEAVLLRFMRAVGNALFDLRSGITPANRQALLDVKAEIDAILNR